MPTLYNFDKDFNSIDNKEKISKAFDCFTPEELKVIEDAPEAFIDPCFGEKAEE